jgi:hypothetical protein
MRLYYASCDCGWRHPDWCESLDAARVVADQHDVEVHKRRPTSTFGWVRAYACDLCGDVVTEYKYHESLDFGFCWPCELGPICGAESEGDVCRQRVNHRGDHGQLYSKRWALASKHGTPEQFEDAMWRAAPELEYAEVVAAIEDYRRQYSDAGRTIDDVVLTPVPDTPPKWRRTDP